MRKLVASLLAALPLLAAAQESAASAPPPQYPPHYVPPPQYTPPPPTGQYAPPPQQSAAAPAQPQPYRPLRQRDTWYIGFGFGGGDARITLPGTATAPAGTFTMKEFFGTTPTKVALNFKVGATLTPRLLLGADLNVFAAAATYDTPFGEAERSLGIGTLTCVATYFPMETGFFVRGGLGLANISTRLSQPGFADATDEASGVAMTGGLGYAFWLGRQFNLTANADVSGQRYGGSSGPESSSFWTLGLGLDWY